MDKPVPEDILNLDYEPAFTTVDPSAGRSYGASQYMDIRTTRRVGNLASGEVIARVYVQDETGENSRLRHAMLAAMLKTLNTLDT